MGQLYNQMKMDLELKNFSPKTITCYLDCMVHFVRHYGRSPVEMGEEEIRSYLYYLMKEKKVTDVNYFFPSATIKIPGFPLPPKLAFFGSR